MEAGRRVVVVLAMLRENQRMADIDLSRKFPDMQPITAAPSLQMINGIGTTV